MTHRVSQIASVQATLFWPDGTPLLGPYPSYDRPLSLPKPTKLAITKKGGKLHTCKGKEREAKLLSPLDLLFYSFGHPRPQRARAKFRLRELYHASNIISKSW